MEVSCNHVNSASVEKVEQARRICAAAVANEDPNSGRKKLASGLSKLLQ